MTDKDNLAGLGATALRVLRPALDEDGSIDPSEWAELMAHVRLADARARGVPGWDANGSPVGP